MAQIRKEAMINGVQNIIDYVFQDASVLWEALQAPGSFPYAAEGRDFRNGNKRLALLGDAILKVSLLEEWYSTATNISLRLLRTRYPKDIQKVLIILSGIGNELVATAGSNTNLAIKGRLRGLDGFVNNNPSQGNTVSDRTVAQTVEAILGAVWLDSKDLATVRHVMETMGLGVTSPEENRLLSW